MIIKLRIMKIKNIKTQIFVWLLACSMLSVHSCNDFLEVNSPDELTSSTFWRDSTDAVAALSAVYSMLECAVDVWEFAEIKWPVEAYREDICDMGSDAYSYQNWMELYHFSYTNGNSQFTLYWKHHYRGISFANQLLEKINEIPSETLPDASRSGIIAEARFLRAYYHMKLLLNWDQVIIRDHYITSQDGLNESLSGRPETWDFILSELETAAKVLPADYPSSAKGRATKGAAYAYLGFGYLTRAYEEPGTKNASLEKALDAFSQVKGYSLVKDFISMFDGSNKNSPESVFELQFTETTANGASYRTALHKWMAVSELSGWDEILPSAMLMTEFMKEGQVAVTGRYDSRLYHTVFFNDPYFNDPANPRVYGSTYGALFGAGATKPAFRKYLPRTYEDLQKSRTGLNVPLMRYSNVLLMQAEALNELGRTAEAIPLINQVRERADMPAMTGTSQTDVRTQIEHERILEFPMENFRFYDLRRWGKTKEALDAANRSSFDPAKHSFYPVPQTEIQSNDAIR